MTISVTCKECDASLSLAAKFAGKRIKCPRCAEPLRVPAGTPPTRTQKQKPQRSKSPAKPARRTSAPRPTKTVTPQDTGRSSNSNTPDTGSPTKPSPVFVFGIGSGVGSIVALAGLAMARLVTAVAADEPNTPAPDLAMEKPPVIAQTEPSKSRPNPAANSPADSAPTDNLTPDNAVPNKTEVPNEAPPAQVPYNSFTRNKTSRPKSIGNTKSPKRYPKKLNLQAPKVRQDGRISIWAPDSKNYISSGRTHRVTIISALTGEVSTHHEFYLGNNKSASTDKVGGILALDCTPNADIITAGTDLGAFAVFDTISGRKVEDLAFLNGPINGAAITPDGSVAYGGGADGTIKWLSTTSGESGTVSGTGSTEITRLKVTADGKRLLSGDAAGAITVYSTETNEPVKNFTAHGDGIAWFAISPNQKILAVSGMNGQLTTWDLDTYEETYTMNGHSTPCYNLSFTPDSTQLFSVSNYFRGWDLDTGRVIEKHKFRASKRSAGASPDGRLFLHGGFLYRFY